jgi:Kef-type K+ transport system membrane component KefB
MTTNSAVEFLLWLLIAASVIAVIAARLKLPYTVALVLGGLVLGSVHLPIVDTLISNKPDWLTPSITLGQSKMARCLIQAEGGSVAKWEDQENQFAKGE